MGVGGGGGGWGMAGILRVSRVLNQKLRESNIYNSVRIRGAPPS